MGDPVSLLWGARAPLQLKAALIMKLWCSADPYSLPSLALSLSAHNLHQLYRCSWCVCECEKVVAYLVCMLKRGLHLQWNHNSCTGVYLFGFVTEVKCACHSQACRVQPKHLHVCVYVCEHLYSATVLFWGTVSLLQHFQFVVLYSHIVLHVRWKQCTYFSICLWWLLLVTEQIQILYVRRTMTS